MRVSKARLACNECKQRTDAHALSTAVILNEHLIEAMRRLKRDSGENSVDRYVAASARITSPFTDTGFFDAADSCRMC